jgi:hypothetical protein
MNEYTVANARKLYCDINSRKERTAASKRMAGWGGEYTEYGFNGLLKILADYPWYVRIWARLTYKL